MYDELNHHADDEHDEHVCVEVGFAEAGGPEVAPVHDGPNNEPGQTEEGGDDEQEEEPPESTLDVAAHAQAEDEADVDDDAAEIEETLHCQPGIQCEADVVVLNVLVGAGVLVEGIDEVHDHER